MLPPAPIPGLRASAPVAGVLPDGGALLVYQAATPGADAVWSSDRPPGGTWAEKVLVSDLGGESTEPRVVVDSAGNATAIWRHLDNLASTTVIKASFRPAGGTWGPPAPLSAAAANGAGDPPPRRVVVPPRVPRDDHPARAPGRVGQRASGGSQRSVTPDQLSAEQCPHRRSIAQIRPAGHGVTSRARSSVAA